MTGERLRATLGADTARDGLWTFPGDPGWDDARRAFNLAVDQHPECVAHPADAGEVAAVVRAAAAAGVRIAPQGTGHGAGPLGPLDGAVLVRLGGLDRVEVDPATRIARIGGGARWGAVGEAAAPHGLWPLSGSSPTVGVAGFLLGGGIPLLGREFGVGSNRVRAIEVVTAEGEIVRADAEREPDLFWSLRGAGGNFGVVTAIEVELLELREVQAGCLFFPMERAGEVLPAWNALAESAPDWLTVIGRLLRVPDMPGVPPPLAGRDFAIVEVVATRSEEELEPFVAPLRALGPEMDMLATMPAAGLARLHMDPEDPVPALGDHLITGPLPQRALDALLAAAGPDSGSSLLSVELRPLGGAFARPPADGGAVAALPGAFALFAVGIAAGPDLTAATSAGLAAVRGAMRAYAVGLAPTFAEATVEAAELFGDPTAARLRTERRRWDPQGLMVANHPV